MRLSLAGLGGILVSRWDSIRGSYWFIPSLMSAMAAGLAFGLIELDQALTSAGSRRLIWIHETGPEGTRAILSTVAGSMITVTGVVFSITIVALTLASSQFGPRLLRNFLRDRSTQLVLGTFVSTFLYSVLVLRAVESDWVPHVATAAALVLMVTSVFVLIYFVHHAASSIQASNVIASVVAEIETELPRLFPEQIGEGAPDGARTREASSARPEGEARTLHATRSGYLRVIGAEPLFALSVENDLVVDIQVRPGDFVTEGDVLARVFPADRCSDETVAALCESFVVGILRTGVQDLDFLTGQLAEMAVRALSPGINDPHTAVLCVHRLGSVVATVADREMPVPERCDDEGNLRVLSPATRFADIVGGCFDPIRRYGVGDAAVVEAVLVALARGAERAGDASRRTFLLEQAQGWSQGFEEEGRVCSQRDRERIEWALARVEKAAASTTADRG